MNVGSELEKLNQLHKDGVLSETEFAAAKINLLKSLAPENSIGSGVHFMGKAAYKFVNFKIISAIVGGVLALVFFFTFFLPQWQKMDREFDDAIARNNKFSNEVNKFIADDQKDMNKRSQQFNKNFEETKREMEEFRKKNGIN